jgi:lipopolysaccharide/colanic/teichoic acid biosynthesis glycosyltransferase
MLKRFFDIIFSLLGLITFSPIFIVVAILIKLESRGPIFYRQARVGRNFVPFILYKFRSMYNDERNRGPLITTGDDPRITKMGKFLRKTKIDELPQLYNVLKGDMSLVGPRPEVEKYVKFYEKEYEEILTIRPGMTDISSLKFSNEEDILAKSDNSEHYYINVLLPQKINLSNDYIAKASFLYDLKLIVMTIIKIMK